MAIPSNYNLDSVQSYPELKTLETSKKPIPKLIYPSSLKSNDAIPLTYIRFEVVDYSSASLQTSRDAFDRLSDSAQVAINNNRSTEDVATIAGAALAGGLLASNGNRVRGALLGGLAGAALRDYLDRPDADPSKAVKDFIVTDVGKSLVDITKTNLKERTVSEPEAIIWLPEPDRLPYEYNAKYQDVDLTATQRAVDVIKAITNSSSKTDGVLSNTLKEIGISTINDIIKRAGNSFGGELEFEKYVRAQTRMIPNPTQEFLFEGVTRRGFDFQFRLYAKSKEEAKTIFEILRTFKSNMLPSRATNQVNSFYLKFPKLFRIQHRFIDQNGIDSENKYLPQMKLCSLESVSADYTDSGRFSVFDETILLGLVGEGKAPVGISLSLTFKETELLTSEDMQGDKAH